MTRGNRYRMIAIDLDGTLLSPHGQVTPRTKAAVHRALDAGLLVCFATGRNFTESRTVLQAVAHYDAAVFVSGAMVIDTRHRITLYRKPMQPSLAAEVCAELEAAGHAALALQDESATGIDYLISDGIDINESTANWMQATQAIWRRVPSLGTYHHQHTVRCGVVAAPAQIEQLRQRLARRFNGRAFYHSIHVPPQNVQVLEVFDPSVNKWQGILHVARRHGISAEQIIAVGDDINDLPMIRHAGLGVAMGNARPQVQQAAKLVIGSNQHEGLACFLEELLHTTASADTCAAGHAPAQQ
ncbi:MAG TPA: Cof-type HAD-IIB family hydrolase [Tepidisphaeraceae bacterium]|nr:Cof-type HAD-IIB family hydrolase [Tepidisphaeraceae bacterium]